VQPLYVLLNRGHIHADQGPLMWQRARGKSSRSASLLASRWRNDNNHWDAAAPLHISSCLQRLGAVGAECSTGAEAEDSAVHLQKLPAEIFLVAGSARCG